MVVFGGCTHAEAYNDLWRLSVTDRKATWVQLQITGVERLYDTSEMRALQFKKALESLCLVHSLTVWILCCGGDKALMLRGLLVLCARGLWQQGDCCTEGLRFEQARAQGRGTPMQQPSSAAPCISMVAADMTMPFWMICGHST